MFVFSLSFCIGVEVGACLRFRRFVLEHFGGVYDKYKRRSRESASFDDHEPPPENEISIKGKII
ncbi:hypothetical protein Bca101_053428 [Brassica carinata]